jgi:hypothetical protein
MFVRKFLVPVLKAAEGNGWASGGYPFIRDQVANLSQGFEERRSRINLIIDSVVGFLLFNDS